MSNASHDLQSQLNAVLKNTPLAPTAPEKTPYTKPSKSLGAHLELLESRGLIITDKEQARHYLKFLGYFRISGYAKYFQEDGSNKFKENVTFDNVFEHYKFDRKLSILIVDVLKRVEIAIRVVISNHMSERYGRDWLNDSSLFKTDDAHRKTIDSIKDSIFKNRHDPIVKQYYIEHNEPEIPPSWMLCEIMPMGFWSRTYSIIKLKEDRSCIAANFKLTENVMENFLHSITSLRNICAHHGRLWNRTFSIKPMKSKKHKNVFNSLDSLNAQLIVVKIFIDVIAKGSSWVERLSNLFDEYPTASLSMMGFPEDWKLVDFWGLNQKL